MPSGRFRPARRGAGKPAEAVNERPRDHCLAWRPASGPGSGRTGGRRAFIHRPSVLATARLPALARQARHQIDAFRAAERHVEHEAQQPVDAAVDGVEQARMAVVATVEMIEQRKQKSQKGASDHQTYAEIDDRVQCKIVQSRASFMVAAPGCIRPGQAGSGGRTGVGVRHVRAAGLCCRDRPGRKTAWRPNVSSCGAPKSRSCVSPTATLRSRRSGGAGVADRPGTWDMLRRRRAARLISPDITFLRKDYDRMQCSKSRQPCFVFVDRGDNTPVRQRSCTMAITTGRRLGALRGRATLDGLQMISARPMSMTADLFCAAPALVYALPGAGRRQGRPPARAIAFRMSGHERAGSQPLRT